MSATHAPALEETGGTSGTATAEAVGGIAAIVLTILGLAHVVPTFLVAIATIAIGGALLAQGASSAAQYGRLMAGRADMPMPLGGSSAWSIALLAGAAGIVLGILALLDVSSVELVAIASIGFGGGLVLSTAALAQMAVVRANATYAEDHLRRLATETASTSAVAQGMTGLAAVVLGILALAGFSSVTLVLIALLTIGVFLVINGPAFGGLMLNIFRH